MIVCFFFFQAEDGIRDLVGSRGLGDVYKSQEHVCSLLGGEFCVHRRNGDGVAVGDVCEQLDHVAVSYTHLTLPTSDLV